MAGRQAGAEVAGGLETVQVPEMRLGERAGRGMLPAATAEQRCWLAATRAQSEVIPQVPWLWLWLQSPWQTCRPRDPTAECA